MIWQLWGESIWEGVFLQCWDRYLAWCLGLNPALKSSNDIDWRIQGADQHKHVLMYKNDASTLKHYLAYSQLHTHAHTYKKKKIAQPVPSKSKHGTFIPLQICLQVLYEAGPLGYRWEVNRWRTTQKTSQCGDNPASNCLWWPKTEWMRNRALSLSLSLSHFL